MNDDNKDKEPKAYRSITQQYSSAERLALKGEVLARKSRAV